MAIEEPTMACRESWVVISHRAKSKDGLDAGKAGPACGVASILIYHSAVFRITEAVRPRLVTTS